MVGVQGSAHTLGASAILGIFRGERGQENWPHSYAPCPDSQRASPLPYLTDGTLRIAIVGVVCPGPQMLV